MFIKTKYRSVSMQVNLNTPLIYDSEVKEMLESNKKSLKNLIHSKTESKALPMIGLFASSCAFLKTKTSGAKASIAGLGFSLICGELYSIVKLANKINSINQDLEKVKRLQSFAKATEVQIPNNDFENVNRINADIEKVNIITDDSTKILTEAKSAAKLSLGLRVAGLVGIIFVGIGALALSKTLVIGGLGVLAIAKPLMVVGGAIYLASQCLLPGTEIKSEASNTLKTIKKEANKVLTVIDDLKKLEMYVDQLKIQKETNRPLYNDDMVDSLKIINDNISYYQKKLNAE